MKLALKREKIKKFVSLSFASLLSIGYCHTKWTTSLMRHYPLRLSRNGYHYSYLSIKHALKVRCALGGSLYSLPCKRLVVFHWSFQ